MSLDLERTIIVEDLPQLTLVGEIDFAARPQLSRTIDEVARAGRPLVLDLSGVSFMDSTGVHAVIRANAITGECTILHGVHGQVEQLFELITQERPVDGTLIIPRRMKAHRSSPAADA